MTRARRGTAGTASARADALPPRLRRYVVAMGVAGAASLFAAGLSPSFQHVPPLGAALLATLFFAVGDLALLHNRFGHNHYSITWSEIALVFGLVMLPSGWVVVVATAAVAISQALTKRAAPKLLFNVASTATGAAMARLVCLVLDVPEPGRALGSVRTWLVLAAATFVFAVWSGVTVAFAVALSQGLSVLAVLRKGALLQVGVWIGNTLAGVAIATVAQERAGAYVVLPLFLALLYYLYFSYVQLGRDRETWQVLQEMSGALARLDRGEIADVVLTRAVGLFRAEYVELMLVDEPGGDSATVWRTTASAAGVVEAPAGHPAGTTYWARAVSEREPFLLSRAAGAPRQRAELEQLGLEVCVVVPLSGAEECLGALRVGFGGDVRLRSRENQVLRTLANQLAVAVQNAFSYERAREERATLRRVVDNTSDGILSVDATGAVTTWNPAMERMTGLAAADVVGRPFTLGPHTVDGHGTPTDLAWIWATLADDTSAQRTVAVATPSLPRRWLALSLAAVRRPAGDVDSVVVVARDVTALHEARRAKEDFLATVSHELRTPLTSLKGWVVTLLRPEFQPPPDVQREVYERLLHQTDRLHHLIEDILDVSALDRGEFRVEAEPVAVDDLVDKSVADFALCWPDRPVTHRRAGLAGLALADPGRVEQILANLLSNAAKYSPAGSPVEVLVDRVGGDVHVSVVDRGRGVPPDKLHAVFEPFVRLGDHMTREQPGTGVGLHIARRLAEAMHGRIWVRSSPGRGSTFTFSLPAAPLVAVVAQPAPQLPAQVPAQRAAQSPAEPAAQSAGHPAPQRPAQAPAQRAGQSRSA